MIGVAKLGMALPVLRRMASRGSSKLHVDYVVVATIDVATLGVFASMVSYGIETSKGHGDEALRRSASV
jgi:hypothetical protein